MVSGDEAVSGNVEVGVICLGSSPEERAQTGWASSAMVAIAVEIRVEGLGRIQMEEVPANDDSTIQAFLLRVARPGVTARQSPDDTALQSVAYVGSALRRWLRRVYCGGVQPHHLRYYLQEFAFRANNRHLTNRGELFLLLLSQALQCEPATYKLLLSRGRQHAQKRKNAAVGQR